MLLIECGLNSNLHLNSNLFELGIEKEIEKEKPKGNPKPSSTQDPGPNQTQARTPLPSPFPCAGPAPSPRPSTRARASAAHLLTPRRPAYPASPLSPLAPLHRARRPPRLAALPDPRVSFASFLAQRPRSSRRFSRRDLPRQARTPRPPPPYKKGPRPSSEPHLSTAATRASKP